MNATSENGDKPLNKLNFIGADGVPVSLLGDDGKPSTEKFAAAMKAAGPEAATALIDGLAAINPAREIYEGWCAGTHRLERPVGSAAYKLVEAVEAKNVIRLGDVDDKLVFGLRGLALSPFVIEHNWASAFAGAQDFAEGEYKIPYETSLFEFRDTGRRVCIVTGEAGNALFMQYGEHWIAWEWDPLTGPLADQVRAVCVALDAEVAIRDTVRAPERLNRARAASGSTPLLDYHVVRLSRRERASPLEEHDDTSKRHRLHFVRGHWRHYETHKTWIKWHLRGDPDLGFIEKHYRL